MLKSIRELRVRLRNRKAKRYYDELINSNSEDRNAIMISWGKNKTFEETCLWMTQVKYPNFTP